MKALNYQEVTKIVEVLNKNLRGARLQKVNCLPNGVVLEFYNQGEYCFVTVDLAKSPFIMISNNKQNLMKSKPKPIEIFLRSHFSGSFCLSVNQPEDHERYLNIEFSNHRYIQVQFAPNAKNISAYANAKAIHFKKPVKLPEAEKLFVPKFIRNYEEMLEEYQSDKQITQPKVQSPGNSIEKRIKKVKEDINKHKLTVSKYKKLLSYVESFEGGWSGLLEYVPAEFSDLWDINQPVFVNYDKANEKFKQLQSKYKRAIDQLDQIKSSPNTEKTSKSPESYKKVDVNTRKLSLKSGAIAYVGKSSKDNLVLLRNAKAWFLWMHLKDMPGSHVIVARNKNQKIDQNELFEVAKWLLKQQFSQKKQKKGEKFDVIYTECRYVRPIKGNKAGLVNYQNESTITVKLA